MSLPQTNARAVGVPVLQGREDVNQAAQQPTRLPIEERIETIQRERPLEMIEEQRAQGLIQQESVAIPAQAPLFEETDLVDLEVDEVFDEEEEEEEERAPAPMG
jgi:hypothetical protein